VALISLMDMQNQPGHSGIVAAALMRSLPLLRDICFREVVYRDYFAGATDVRVITQANTALRRACHKIQVRSITPRRDRQHRVRIEYSHNHLDHSVEVSVFELNARSRNRDEEDLDAFAELASTKRKRTKR
jgi:hypothetical protein